MGQSVTLLNAVTGTSNGTAIDLSADPESDSIVFQVTTNTSMTATIVPEATVEDSTWVAVACQDLNDTSRSRTVSITGTGLYRFDGAEGLSQFRSRISVHTLGAVTVKARVL